MSDGIAWARQDEDAADTLAAKFKAFQHAQAEQVRAVEEHASLRHEEVAASNRATSCRLATDKAWAEFLVAAGRDKK